MQQFFLALLAIFAAIIAFLGYMALNLYCKIRPLLISPLRVPAAGVGLVASIGVSAEGGKGR